MMASMTPPIVIPRITSLRINGTPSQVPVGHRPGLFSFCPRAPAVRDRLSGFGTLGRHRLYACCVNALGLPDRWPANRTVVTWGGLLLFAADQQDGRRDGDRRVRSAQ